MSHGFLARVAVALVGFAVLAGCDEGPADEASPLDPSKYKGDRMCELPSKKLLAEAGMTEPGEPGKFMGGDGCDWSEEGVVQLRIDTRRSLKSANVGTDTRYRSSEAGTIAGYPSLTNRFKNSDGCRVYVGISPTAHFVIRVSYFGSREKNCKIGEDLLASAVERVKSG